MTSTGVAGPAVVDLVAAVVLHRADAAEDRAGEEDVADLQRPRLDEHGRDVAAAGLAARLEHDAAASSAAGAVSSCMSATSRISSSR